MADRFPYGEERCRQDQPLPIAYWIYADGNYRVAARLIWKLLRNPTIWSRRRRHEMDSIIYLVGLIVVVMLILSVLGLR